MIHWFSYTVGLAVVAGAIRLLIYRPELARRDTLKNSRQAGCILGGCVIPSLLLGVALAQSNSAYDLGGPLLWPLTAAFGALLGIVLATLCFIVFQRGK